jgi:acetate kinase
LGLEFDHHRNDVGEQVISSDRSQCRVFVIHTDDEAIIAQHSLRLLDGRRATAGNHHPVEGDGAA